MSIDGFAEFISGGRMDGMALYRQSKRAGTCLRVAQICAHINECYGLTRKHSALKEAYQIRDKEFYLDYSELDARCQAYFDYHDIMGQPYGLVGLAEFLGITRNDIVNFLMDNDDPEISRLIRFHLTRIESDKESAMLNGQLGIAQMKFYMMNNHDWTDKLSSQSVIKQEDDINMDTSAKEQKSEFIDILLSIGVPKGMISKLNLDFLEK